MSKASLLASTAVMQVFDFNRFSKHSIIGELRVQLGSIDWNHVIEEWRDLVEPAKFEVTSNTQRLPIVVVKAFVPTVMFVDAGRKPGGDLLVSALRSHGRQTDCGDPGGQEPESHGRRRSVRSDRGWRSMLLLRSDFINALFLDPYVKVQLALDKRKWKKKRTSVKKKTLNPYYNESFTFDVSFEEIQVSVSGEKLRLLVSEFTIGCNKQQLTAPSCCCFAGGHACSRSCFQRANLVVSVWDHDTVTRNDAMGKIFLGADATGNQLKHWADMLTNPRRPVAQWHSLLSAEQVNSTLALKRKIPLVGKLPF